MLSSNDVAALFAAQGQQFSGQNYYAQTIGISNPAMSIGAYGPGPMSGFQPVGGSFPGVRAPPPVFSYAPSGPFGPGYGGGNAVAGTMMSGFGAAATAGGIGLGLASAFGPLRGVAPMIDPIAGFMSGYGGMTARGLMGGVAGAMPGLAVGALAAHGIGSFVGGAHQQANISNQLGSFGFVNSASRTGMGFTRQDASDIGGAIRQLAYVPDMLTSVEELTRLLPRLRQSGVMSGVKDAAEFNRRFKETITTIRDMSKMLGSTMEEATQFFEHNRMLGITSRTGQLQNVLNAQFTSGYTGMNMGTTMQMQMGGAGIARQFGARGAYGSQGVTNMAQRIQAGLQGGFINEELLTDVTGMTGPDAVGAASQKMYSFMTGLSQTSAGQLIMAGAMKRDANGKVVLDDEMIARLNRGEVSADDLRSRANRLSDNDKISFRYQAKNLGGQFAGRVDLPRFLQGLVGNKGDEAAGLMLQQYSGGQMSEADISLLTGMGRGSAGIDFQNFARIRGREMKIRESTDPEIIWKRIKTKLHAGTFGQVEQAGADIFESVGKAYDNFIDDLVGRHVITLSKEGAQAFQQAMSGGGSRGLRELLTAAHGLGQGGGLISGDSAIATAIRRFSNEGTTGLTASGRQGMIASLLTGGTSAKQRAMELAIDKGSFSTAAGRAAEGDLSSLQTRLNFGGEFGRADQARRVQMLRSGMAGSIGNALVGVFGDDAFGVDRANELQDILENYSDEAASKFTGVTGSARDIRKAFQAKMGELAGKMGDTEGGRFLMAAATSKAFQEGLAQDFLTGGLITMKQKDDELRASFAAASGGGGALTVQQAEKKMRDAEAALRKSGLSGESRAIIRTNGAARGILNELLASGDPKKREAIQKALQGGLSVDQAADMLRRTYGMQVSAKDVLDAKTAFQNAQSSGKIGELRDAVGAIQSAQLGIDGTVLRERISGAADALRRSSASGGVGAAAATGIADALAGLGAATSDEQVTTAMSTLQTSMRQAMDAYTKLSKGQRGEFIESLGPAGQAVAAGADLYKRLEGVTGSISRQKLREMGMSETEISSVVGKVGSVNLSPEMRKMLAQAVAGERSSLSYGVGAGAAETGDRMVDTLTKIQQNADKQTGLLEIMATVIGGKKYEDQITKIVGAQKATAESN